MSALRPREHYALHGPSPLSDEALLALVLGNAVTTTGGRVEAQQVARTLLDRHGGLVGLSRAPLQAFLDVPGIGQARAVALHASLALGRRAAWRPETGPPRRVRCPDDAWAAVRHLQGDDAQEELHGLYLGSRGQVLGLRALTRGSERYTVVDPRQVYRPAVALGAQRVIVAHVHPSGDPTPSNADIEVTRRLLSAGRTLGIQLVDHLVLGSGSYVSLAEQKLIQGWHDDPTMATGQSDAAPWLRPPRPAPPGLSGPR